MPNRLFYGSKFRLVNHMGNTHERIKILINSSTPIVVMETVEERRALTLVRTACAELNMAVFEWSIADGLVRCGANAPASPPVVSGETTNPKNPVYNTFQPVQALANMESTTLEAVFVLKDFHR